MNFKNCNNIYIFMSYAVKRKLIEMDKMDMVKIIIFNRFQKIPFISLIPVNNVFLLSTA